jgi:hypothetical protein
MPYPAAIRERGTPKKRSQLSPAIPREILSFIRYRRPVA